MIVSVEISISVSDTVAVMSVALMSRVTANVSTVLMVPELMVVVAGITDVSSTVASEPGVSEVWIIVMVYVVETIGPDVGRET